MHPGSLREQYNVCGKAGCRCKDPKKPQKHGPYYQLSYTWRGKSSTPFCASGAGGPDAPEGGQLQALPRTGERVGGPGSGTGAGRAGEGETGRWRLIPTSCRNDPAALRQMVMSLLEEVETKDRRLRQLQHWLEQLLRHRYGPKRERVDENQLFLFAAAMVSRREAPREPEARPRRRKPQAVPAQRPGMAGSGCRSRWSGGGWSTIWPTANGSAPSARGSCSTSARRSASGWSTCRPRWHVIQEACQKYACAKGCTVVTAQKPMAPIEKGLAGTGTAGARGGEQVSGIIFRCTARRRSSRGRAWSLSRQTMCDWMRQCAELVSPLVRSDEGAGVEFESRADRRHAGAGAGPGAAAHAHRADLDLRRGRASIPTRCTTTRRIAAATGRMSS